MLKWCILLFCMLSYSIKMIFYCVPASWIFISWEFLRVFIFSAVLREARVTVSIFQIETELAKTWFFANFKQLIKMGSNLHRQSPSPWSLFYVNVEIHQGREDETGLLGHFMIDHSIRNRTHLLCSLSPFLYFLLCTYHHLTFAAAVVLLILPPPSLEQKPRENRVFSQPTSQRLEQFLAPNRYSINIWLMNCVNCCFKSKSYPGF